MVGVYLKLVSIGSADIRIHFPRGKLEFITDFHSLIPKGYQVNTIFPGQSGQCCSEVDIQRQIQGYPRADTDMYLPTCTHINGQPQCMPLDLQRGAAPAIELFPASGTAEVLTPRSYLALGL